MKEMTLVFPACLFCLFLLLFACFVSTVVIADAVVNFSCCQVLAGLFSIQCLCLKNSY